MSLLRPALRAGLALGAILLGLAAPAAAEPVAVLYAGSLVNLMEHGIGAGFNAATGDDLQGFAGGSNGLANQIRGRLRRADVFISAVPGVNAELMGPANGAWLTWYVGFAQSPVVIGYSPASRFADALKTRPWYQVLQEPGIRIGRTDPKLDPKGALTVQLLDHAEQVYQQPGLARAVLGAPQDTTQIMPEEALVGRVQSGQLDAGFFYATETTDLKIPAIPLAPEVATGAHYTVAILRDAPHPAAARRFLTFLLGPRGRDIMRQHGLDPVPPSVGGDTATLPPGLEAEIDALK